MWARRRDCITVVSVTISVHSLVDAQLSTDAPMHIMQISLYGLSLAQAAYYFWIYSEDPSGLKWLVRVDR